VTYVPVDGGGVCRIGIVSLRAWLAAAGKLVVNIGANQRASSTIGASHG